MRLDLSWRAEDGLDLPMALWRPGPGYRMISTGVLGGGLGPREWVLNAQVPAAYARTDPAAHLGELAARPGPDRARCRPADRGARHRPGPARG